MAGTYSFSPVKRRSILNLLSVTLILLIVNVVVFLFLVLAVNLGLFPEGFIERNVAISLENIEELRLWTFFTSMFMHEGLFHLFANMFSLLFLGSFVERIIGRKRFFNFYLIAGLLGSVFYIVTELIFPSGFGAVGASGAIFGVAGLMVVLTPNIPLYVMFIPIPIKAKYAVPGILLILWMVSIGGNVPIGNTAHLGGLIAGLGYGFYLRNKYKRKVKLIGRHFS